MKNTINLCLIATLFIVASCSNEPISDTNLDTINDNLKRSAATQITGVGYFADSADCDYESEDADFALILTGDLEGCLYVFVDDSDCSPSGTYREEGRELFGGTYNGESGSFRTNCKFEAKFEGCEDGFFLGAEIFGRCQHPIQK